MFNQHDISRNACMLTGGHAGVSMESMSMTENPLFMRNFGM